MNLFTLDVDVEALKSSVTEVNKDIIMPYRWQGIQQGNCRLCR